MFQTTNQLIVANPIIPSPTESTIGDPAPSLARSAPVDRKAYGSNRDSPIHSLGQRWATKIQVPGAFLVISAKVGGINWLSLNPRVVDAFDCYFLINCRTTWDFVNQNTHAECDLQNMKTWGYTIPGLYKARLVMAIPGKTYHPTCTKKPQWDELPSGNVLQFVK